MSSLSPHRAAVGEHASEARGATAELLSIEPRNHPSMRAGCPQSESFSQECQMAGAPSLNTLAVR